MSNKLSSISRVLKLHFSQSNPPGKTFLVVCVFSGVFRAQSNIGNSLFVTTVNGFQAIADVRMGSTYASGVNLSL